MKNPLLLACSIGLIVCITGCKPNDPQADARQAAKERLAAGNRHDFVPHTRVIHRADRFPVSFPRELTAPEQKLVGTWEGNGYSMFAEGPTKYLVRLNRDGSGEIINFAPRFNPATQSHEWPLNLWNDGPLFPWQIGEDGLLHIPHCVLFAFKITGKSLVLTADARIKTVKLTRRN